VAVNTTTKRYALTEKNRDVIKMHVAEGQGKTKTACIKTRHINANVIKAP